MVAARTEALRILHQRAGYQGILSNNITKLVAYTSTEGHSCVRKAANLCLVQIRALESGLGGALSQEVLFQVKGLVE